MLKQVTDFLKQKTDGLTFYRGLQDKSKPFSATLYPLNPRPKRVTIGPKGYSEHFFTVAFLGNKNYDQSYDKALELLKVLEGSNFKAGDIEVIQLICLFEDPLYIGFNESQLCEFMIDFKIIRKEK